ncbi:type II toxin-antitoxin system PemK/MazF family toxin [Aestuariimicrobium sp. T2.26MG-19.2B]|uniref:type II toxin-antitoxin system PemK/MazF family toxin n=1 Tax=Aestuariimicrobium sp. T2.26MG-19.2B TaxID=3040679 RepID=UPI002477465D|nr:type II toxin-antitoxin system PemK/MazF family toxin [Aestuariimicrobium sp. T2.26MG-19.2B]CAI9401704.1 hypothetical protein AESSP_00645 [Aestuariimicrobium sp. T2.26MG-19.2B]
MANSWGRIIADALARAARSTLRDQLRKQTGSKRTTTRRRPTTRTTSKARGARPPGARPHEDAADTSAYPGDYQGDLSITYAPNPGDLPDPGEVVWTWVPYEEDHRAGKDRPVLLIGRDGDWLLALPLTSKDHDRDVEQEARAGRHWIDIGTGTWDKRGRQSEARVDRIIRVDPAACRTAGIRLDEGVFQKVADEVRRHR